MAVRNKNFLKNIVSNVGGGLGAKVIAPIIQILIARLLSPSDYGFFAVAMAIVYLYDVYKDIGLIDAIIANYQSAHDISTQFTVQLTTAIFSYGLIVIVCLSLIHTTTLSPQLAGVIMSSCVVFLIYPIIDPLITYHRVKQNYKILAIRHLILGISTGIIGLTAAVFAFGAYSLAIGFVLGNVFSAIYMMSLAKRPQIRFKIKRLKSLLMVAKHIVLQRASGFLVSHGDTFIISHFLGAQKLGVYRMSHQLNNLLPSSTLFFVNQVLFTEFSDRAKIKDYPYIEQIYSKYALFSGIGMLAVSIFTALFSPTVIELILGGQWEEVVKMVTLLSAGLATGYMCLPNNDLAKIFGFTHIYTILGLFRAISTIVVVFIFAKISLEAVVVAWLVIGLIANVINECIFHIFQKQISLISIKFPLYILNTIWLITIIKYTIY